MTNDEIRRKSEGRNPNRRAAPGPSFMASDFGNSFVIRHSSFVIPSVSHPRMIAGQKIQAVTFDVGGTLIRPWPSVGHVYADVAGRHGVKNLSPETLNRNFAAAWRARRNFQHTREDWARLVDQVFRGICQPPPSRTFFPSIYERF